MVLVVMTWFCALIITEMQSVMILSPPNHVMESVRVFVISVMMVPVLQGESLVKTSVVYLKEVIASTYGVMMIMTTTMTTIITTNDCNN